MSSTSSSQPNKKQQRRTLLHLPDDCWKQILSHIDNTDNQLIPLHETHRQSLSLTCKHLLSTTNRLPCSLPISSPLISHPSLLRRILARFSSFIHTLDFLSFTGDLDHALSVIAENATSSDDLSGVRRLCLSRQDPVPVMGLRGFSRFCDGLKVLDFYNCVSLCDDHVMDICSMFTSVEEIDISVDEKGCLSDVGLVFLAKKLGSSLKKISFSGHANVTDVSVIALSDHCGNLCDVDFVGCGVTQHGVGYILRNSSKLSRLTVNSLVVDSNRWPLSYKIEDSVGFGRNLSRLELYEMDVEDSLLSCIAKAKLPLTNFKVLLCSKIEFSGLSVFLKAYQNLERLEFQWVQFLNDELIEGLVGYFKKMVVISLSFCFDLTAKTFQLLVKHCPLLEEIRMVDAKLGRGEFGEPLVRNCSVKYLEVTEDDTLTDEKLQSIGLMCPNLVKLSLGFCPSLTHQGLGTVLKSCPEIKHLLVSEWKDTLLFGSDLIGLNLKLEALQIVGSKVDDECLSVIAEACPNLLILNLSGCQGVTSKGLKVLISSCTRLQNIALCGCKNLTSDIVTWMVLAGPSLKKIAVSRDYVPSDSDELFFSHGCAVEVMDDGETNVENNLAVYND